MRHYEVLVRADLNQYLSEVFDCLLDCYARREKIAHVYIDDAEAYEQIVLLAPLYHAKHGCKGYAVWYNSEGNFDSLHLKFLRNSF